MLAILSVLQRENCSIRYCFQCLTGNLANMAKNAKIHGGYRWERETMRQIVLALQKCNQRPKRARCLPSRPCARKGEKLRGCGGGAPI